MEHPAVSHAASGGLTLNQVRQKLKLDEVFSDFTDLTEEEQIAVALEMSLPQTTIATTCQSVTLVIVSATIVSQKYYTNLLYIISGGDESAILICMKTLNANVLMVPPQGHDAKVLCI